jgi:hypothetical protein
MPQGTLTLSSLLNYDRSNGIRLADGKLLSYEEMEHEIARPARHFLTEYLVASYALSDHFILSASIPFTLVDEKTFNPRSGYESFYENESGPAGLGDISIQTMLHQESETSELIYFRLGIKLRNAQWEEDPLGTGQSNYFASLGLGLLLRTNLLLNMEVGYTVTDIRRYSIVHAYNYNYHYEYYEADYIFNPGDYFSFHAGLTFEIRERIQLGLQYAYLNQGLSEDRGRELEESQRTASLLSPQLTYWIRPSRLSTSMGLTKVLSGKNSLNTTGITWGLHVII